ncbi:MAG: hypothetical protein MJ252_17465 [archaeon]|nr:hypothetical protein [archaeon]
METEKIGSSQFYWSLPTRVQQAKQKTVDKLVSSLEGIQNDLNTVEEKITVEEGTRQDTPERRANLEELEKLIKQKEECMKTISNFEKQDPEIYERKKKSIKVNQQLSENAIDNIYVIQQWLKNKSGNDLEQMFPSLAEFKLFE